MEERRNYAEGVCYTQIDDEWYNSQPNLEGRRQLKASELFPVPGKAAGEMTAFQHPHLCNCRVFDVA